ncbi:MAG: YbhB/YbcL family Raf kinase inhibitor-like protein [Candidatus Omnitrophica bacterium]|nr:YbhB/YbcL family Raf kinase inhibitor-like protein [Candidatus Omnitrophota bacterium]MBU1047953.1 YbhB/YbcL family Raf kinase inhibitor-like protein [Candidatus Omnitrophota bacterium]MBU1766626.1 YbhB/YbcL family Raf kinase inhibitor-like protein [Candidatus Omnitrophota bacterium]MBU1889764.1 YbhB/YbcL family Raf kinase inhibitor-like protein [Candidatus Omnitrophota bacterium]
MKIKSSTFQNNQLMPSKFTCDGDNINPALVIENIPDGTKSLALIMDDPDATIGTFVHWVVFDMPVISEIKENSIPQGKQGNNSAGQKKYHGPCPPSGTHRYFFKIYALDTMLNLNENTNKAQLEQVMANHIIDNAELIGLYKRR